MSAEDPAEEIRAAAAEVFPSAAASALDAVLAPRREQDETVARYVLTDAHGTRITVRLEVIPLPAGTLARLHTNTTTDNHVIQLADNARPGAAEALLTAQLHELRAIRDSAARAAESRPLDLLVPGPDLPLSPRLTASDRQSLAELNRAAREMSDPLSGSRQRAEARSRFSLMLDDLGLRPAGEGTGDAPAVAVRQAVVAGDLSPPAAAALEDLGRPPGELPAADAAALRQQRTAAPGRGGIPAAARTATLAPRWRDLPDLALAAEQARDERSRATLDRLRARQARRPAGQHPRMPIMIGGGAALAGRDPRVLVIDARHGWQAATLSALGHTADQLGPMAGTGFGDPYEFALGQQRVPVTALAYWADQAAARGPVINGSAALRPGPVGSGLLADISPADGSPLLTVEASGVPVVATGFPAERVPGYALPVPTLPAAARILARYYPDAWPEITSALAEAMPGRALAAWLRQAGDRLAGDESLLAHAAQTIEATAAWESARLQAPELVMTGDDLSYGRTSPHAARRWLIAGTGGLAHTSAELILDANPDAEVVMVGIGAREPLRNTSQYISLTRTHIATHGGDGRLTVVDGQPLLGQLQTVQAAGRTVFRVRGYEGDACVACLGRAGILPGAVDPLARWAYDQGGRIDGDLMHDTRRQYLGYRLQFSAGDQQYQVDVTGAASRVLPTELFPPQVLRQAARDWLREIPPETGNVPGGYLATAVQAHRYLASAREFPGDFRQVQPPRAAPGRRRRPGSGPGTGRGRGHAPGGGPAG